VHIQNRALHEQQRHLVGQLSQANAAKNRLLGMAAHDLRNPLASIRAFAEFLGDGTVGPISEGQRELINTIHAASQSMLNLVNELLDLSVIQAGELKLQREQLLLGNIIAQQVGLANVLSANKGTTILFADPPHLPPILVDEEKIKQVIDNLLSNAVKFSPAGSTIHVRMEAAATGVEVRVRDQGPGIPPGEMGKLFQDFGRTSVKPTGGEKSTGLGLAICKQLVEAHGGNIRADNEANGGCTFMITLPFRR
jgi:signal transduction histidine kinase